MPTLIISKVLKTRFNFIFQVVLILFSITILAQNASQIDVLTTEDGLMFRDVRSIAQDSTGLMWFGTSQGLNRYDGYNFKVYNSDTKNPNFIEEELFTAEMIFDDSGNILWFMANDRLFRLDVRTDKVTEYAESKGVKGKALRLLKTADESIYLITDDYWIAQNNTAKQYLQKLTDDHFEVLAEIPRTNRGFSRFTQDAQEYLWWSTPNGTLKFNLKGELLASYILDSYEWYGSQMKMTPSFFDKDNTHYYFPHEGGIKVFNEHDQSSKLILETPAEISYAIQDDQDYIWFAGFNTLYRMSPKGDFINYTQLLNARFDFTKINKVFIDATKLLWLATDNGLFKIRTSKQLFSNMFKSKKEGWGNTMRDIFEGGDGTIYSLCERAGSIYCKRPDGKIDSITFNDDIELSYAASFFELNDDKTEVYTAGKNLYKINLKTGHTKSYDEFIPKLKVYGPNPLLKLRDGRLLFGYTLSKLTLFNPKTEFSEPLFKPNKDFNEITDLTYFLEDTKENIIWVGTQNNGLLKINLDGSILKTYAIDTQPSISKNHILVLHEDGDGSIWLGTYGGGLNHISADGTTVMIYNKSNGLADNNVVGILSDNKFNLWISTYNGISYFNKSTKQFQNFYTEDGLSHNEFNYASTFKDSKGNFYFGGMNGLNSFKPEQVFKSTDQPNIYFLKATGFDSKNKKSFANDYSYTSNSSLQFSPYVQYFQVDWTMPNYFNNQKNTYWTKLEGFEDDWFYRGNSAALRYNQLPAGDYVLKIKGKDSRGVASASTLSIPIQVRQIFYKEWWFIALLLLTVALIMYAIFRYRFQQALAMERLRTKISSDLHDDVGSLLSGLAMQTELMEINASESDKFKLQKIANISRNAISQMRDLVWSIDSRRETIEDLIERMRELAEELLIPKEINFHINSSNIKNPNKKLPAQTKQNIFLIYKESITNILRHSNATEVSVTLKNNAKGCHLIIQDNGSKKACYKSTGLGLSNMRMRAEQIKGKVSFKTENGFGVYLNLPSQF
jgi:ligand-binding sensor domain-containing protein/two-component sensor histidine kinase